MNDCRRSWTRGCLVAAKMSLLTIAVLAASPASSQSLMTAPSDERFVAGEAILINVALDTAAFVNGGHAIDSAGFVTLPVLGRFMVAGSTRGEVEAFLAQKLANYLRDTHVEAIPAIRLTLLGHWTRQGQYFVSPKSTVWDATYVAGGIAGDRNLDKIVIMRGEQELGISFLDEYSRGRTLAAAGIRSGDIIVAPVPRDNTGAWYWFREGLTAAAQVATIASTLLTAYITYLLLEDSRDEPATVPATP